MSLDYKTAQTADKFTWTSWPGTPRVRMAGNLPGHEFHGNQWTQTPGDALHSLLNGEKVNIDPADVHAFVKKAGKQYEDPDLTDVHVNGHLIFGGNGLGIARADMPQVPKEMREKFLDGVRKSGIKVRLESVSPLTLAPTQKEISARLVAEKLKKYEKDPTRAFPPILVSQDNHILDGHHHWGMMATVAVDSPKVRMPIYRLMTDTQSALKIMHKFDTDNHIAKKSISNRAASMTQSQSRHFHLRAAVGAIRTSSYQNREHIVMPVTALVEGVLHAVNSPIPELVLAEEFGLSLHSWNGRPVMMNHPEARGQKISANDPRVLEQSCIGHVFNTRIEKGALLRMDAWIDPVRVDAVGGDAVRTLERLKAADPNDPIEVSVGVFMVSEAAKGMRNGKPYQAIWRHITPDHLALLPEGKTGACSVAMGCGIRHASTYLATAEGYQEVDMGAKTSLLTRIKTLLKGSPSDDDIRAAISTTESDMDQRMDLQEELKELEPAAFGITAVYSDRIVYGVMQPGTGEVTYYQRGYTGDENSGYTIDGNRVEVEQVTSFEPVSDDDDDVTAAAAAACHCHEGEDMDKKERIAALMAHANNPVKDLKVLEAAPESVLKTLEDHAAKLDADQKAAKDTKDAADAATAALKTAEAATAAAAAAPPKELGEEDFFKMAPASIRTMVERHKAVDAKAHTDLVAKLKTAQAVFTEDQLKLKTLEQLQEIRGTGQGRTGGLLAASGTSDGRGDDRLQVADASGRVHVGTGGTEGRSLDALTSQDRKDWCRQWQLPSIRRALCCSVDRMAGTPSSSMT